MQQAIYYVYFYYDNNDNLLYIGKADDVWRRWVSHKEGWKNEVAKIAVREYPDKAAMDIFETYYIKKLPSKYNNAGTHRGYTEITLYDDSKLSIYTLEEFKNKYKPEDKKNKSEDKKRTRETLKEDRDTIVIETSAVDFFENKILNMDLSKVQFKYKNMFFTAAGREGLVLLKALMKNAVTVKNKKDYSVFCSCKTDVMDARFVSSDVAFVYYFASEPLRKGTRQEKRSGCVMVFEGVTVKDDGTCEIRTNSDVTCEQLVLESDKFIINLREFYEAKTER